LLGVAFANLLRGVPIDAEMNYVGGFFNLLNPYALLAGVTALATFVYYGAIFLSLKTSGEVMEKATAAARRLWIVVVALMLLLTITTYTAIDAIEHLGIVSGLIPLLGIAAILVSAYFIGKKRPGVAFTLTAVSIALAIATLFLLLYPRVMVSSINPDNSLDIYNASSTPYTLTIMTIVALIFTPVVLFYQAWSYRVFRKRLSMESKLEY
jgi:cytochrome bd ubiquinol oxidase subunit II